MGIEHGGDQVDGHRQAQEQLAQQEVTVLVRAKAPQCGKAKCREKAEQVQRPPAFPARNPKNRQVQDGDIGEQAQRAFRFSAQQDRNGIAAQERGERHGPRILDHGQRGPQGSKQDHEGECGQRRHHGVDPRGGKDGQVHDRHPAALQVQGKIRALHPLDEADAKQHRADQARRRQPCLQRIESGIGHQPCQENQAHEQDDKAHPDNGVTAGEPGDEVPQRALGQAWPRRFRLWMRLRHGEPLVLGCGLHNNGCGAGRGRRPGGFFRSGRTFFRNRRHLGHKSPGVSQPLPLPRDFQPQFLAQPRPHRSAQNAAQDKTRLAPISRKPADQRPRHDCPQDHRPSAGLDRGSKLRRFGGN